MRLTDLQPQFRRYEERPCSPGPACPVVSPHTQHEWYIEVDSIDKADGIEFLCPKCFAANGLSDVGTHHVICWRPRIPPHVKPAPGRWEFQGTGYADLTLVAGSSSVKLTDGCGAHFHVTKGAIIDCPNRVSLSSSGLR